MAKEREAVATPSPPLPLSEKLLLQELDTRSLIAALQDELAKSSDAEGAAWAERRKSWREMQQRSVKQALTAKPATPEAATPAPAPAPTPAPTPAAAPAPAPTPAPTPPPAAAETSPPLATTAPAVPLPPPAAPFPSTWTGHFPIPGRALLPTAVFPNAVVSRFPGGGPPPNAPIGPVPFAAPGSFPNASRILVVNTTLSSSTSSGTFTTAGQVQSTGQPPFPDGRVPDPEAGRLANPATGAFPHFPAYPTAAQSPTSGQGPFPNPFPNTNSPPFLNPGTVNFPNSGPESFPNAITGQYSNIGPGGFPNGGSPFPGSFPTGCPHGNLSNAVPVPNPTSGAIPVPVPNTAPGGIPVTGPTPVAPTGPGSIPVGVPAPPEAPSDEEEDEDDEEEDEDGEEDEWEDEEGEGEEMEEVDVKAWEQEVLGEWDKEEDEQWQEEVEEWEKEEAALGEADDDGEDDDEDDVWATSPLNPGSSDESDLECEEAALSAAAAARAVAGEGEGEGAQGAKAGEVTLQDVLSRMSMAQARRRYAPCWAFIAWDLDRAWLSQVLDGFFSRRRWPPASRAPPRVLRVCRRLQLPPQELYLQEPFPPAYAAVLRDIDRDWFDWTVDHFFGTGHWPAFAQLPKTLQEVCLDMGLELKSADRFIADIPKESPKTQNGSPMEVTCV